MSPSGFWVLQLLKYFGNLPIFTSHIISQFPKMPVTDCGNTTSHQE
jgi:hypothetical protein